MPDAYQIIIAPVITEKSVGLKQELNRYTFKVPLWAVKAQIKQAVEELFKVKVKAVNVVPVRGKKRVLGRTMGRTSSWKKAFITLAKGQKIKAMEELM